MHRFLQVIERASGTAGGLQLVAANVGTACYKAFYFTFQFNWIFQNLFDMKVASESKIREGSGIIMTVNSENPVLEIDKKWFWLIEEISKPSDENLEKFMNVECKRSFTQTIYPNR